MFDAATGALVHTLRFHQGAVTDARFSPDSRWIVTAGPGTAAIWSAETGKQLDVLHGPKDLLASAAFAPDSRSIITRERDGTVRRATCEVCGDVEELLSIADARLAATGRVLTDAERRTYVG